MKKIICGALSIILIVFSFCPGLSAVSSNSINDYLLSIGIPQDVIDVLTEGQKYNIVSNIESDATFISYTEATMDLNDSDTRGITPFLGTIPTSKLTISVMSFQLTINGEPITQLAITFYANFKKLALIQDSLENDAFVISLYSGWEFSGHGSHNLRVHETVATPTNTNYDDYLPINSTSYGLEYRFTSNSWNSEAYYEGWTVCNLRKVDSNATHAVNLRYVQDVSINDNSVYTINLMVGGSTISGDTSNLNTRTGNYNF